MHWIAIAIFALGLIHFALKYPEFRLWLLKITKVIGILFLLVVVIAGAYWAKEEWHSASIARQKEADREKAQAELTAAQDFLDQLKVIPVGSTSLEEQIVPRDELELHDVSVAGYHEFVRKVSGRATNHSDMPIVAFKLHFQVYDCPGPTFRHPECHTLSQYELGRRRELGCDIPTIALDRCDKLADEVTQIPLDIPAGQARDFEHKTKSDFARTHSFRGDVFDLVEVRGLSKRELSIRDVAKRAYYRNVTDDVYIVRTDNLRVLRTLVDAAICTVDQIAKVSWVRSENYPLAKVYYSDACGTRVYLDSDAVLLYQGDAAD
jgi:hypothetical protein